MVGQNENLAGTGEQAESDAARPSSALVLERWRLRARISRQRLSDLADVSATYVRTIEAGVDDLGRPVVPSPAIMQKLSHGLALALGDQPGLGLASASDGSAARPGLVAGREQVERTIYGELMAAAGYLAPGAEAGAAVPVSSLLPSAAPVASFGSVLREAADAAYAECAGTLATVTLRDARLLEHARDLLEHWEAVDPADQILILGVMALIHDRWARTQSV